MGQSYRMPAKVFHADTSTKAMDNLDDLVRRRLTADSTYRTHVTIAQGELFVAVPHQVSGLLVEVLSAERRVEQLWGSMSGVMRWNYITQSIGREMLATNEMEGVRSTRREMLDAVEAAERNEGVQATRFGEFARLYLNLTDHEAHVPTSLEDLRDIYDKVALNEIAPEDRPDGELFRARDVEIIGGHGTVVHAGVSGEAYIVRLLTRMLELGRDDGMPGIFAALVSHFIFEYVHPFYDGNGRTGRYLLALSFTSDLSLPTVLSLSQVIAAHKNKYYKAFTEAEDPLNRGELTNFVMTMLELIVQGQQQLIEDLAARSSQLDRAQARCARAVREYALSDQAASMLFMLLQEELFDTRKSVGLASIANELGRSKQSVRKYLDELDRHGLVEFVSRKPIRVRVASSLRTDDRQGD
ncbi:Fic family protein [Bifidobacterium cuniculi]|uniref:Putative bacterial regulatory protein n=2 Tax=Bifidobacterium cuniculi TaxID=1688 RepID=A0A087B2L3_9BIFI|nr:Fic family protein [Bifidobacterium cuniculi]KFI65263.1 putative bacterial regulatory protein [Bifidobacterium cuniculi]